VECLDRFLVLGGKNFDYLVREYVEHYHEERPHQGLGNKPKFSSGPKERKGRYLVPENTLIPLVRNRAMTPERDMFSSRSVSSTVGTPLLQYLHNVTVYHLYSIVDLFSSAEAALWLLFGGNHL
jgi:hypothetical protein